MIQGNFLKSYDRVVFGISDYLSDSFSISSLVGTFLYEESSQWKM